MASRKSLLSITENLNGDEDGKSVITSEFTGLMAIYDADFHCAFQHDPMLNSMVSLSRSHYLWTCSPLQHVQSLYGDHRGLGLSAIVWTPPEFCRCQKTASSDMQAFQKGLPNVAARAVWRKNS